MKAASRTGKRVPRLRLTIPAAAAAARLLPTLFIAAQREARRWVRKPTPTALHDLRVAARRYRAAIRLFRPLLAPRQTRSLMRELDRLSALSGPVRDSDVGASITRIPGGSSRSDARARSRLRDYLSGRGSGKLSRKSSALNEGLISGTRSAASPAFGAFAGKRLKRKLLSLLRTDLPGTIGDARLVHAARKKARRLRYWTEMLVPAGGRRTAMLAALLHVTATALGELHDVDVAIEQHGATRHLRGLRRRRARRATDAWRRLTSPASRRTMDGALEEIEGGQAA